jgi:flagellar biosynthesis/type III secretory pathway protein FliH
MGVVEIIVEDRVTERLAEIEAKGIAKGKAEGIEEGKAKGQILQTISVVTKILSAFPTWEDEKIADLVTTTVDVVANIRASLPKA